MDYSLLHQVWGNSTSVHRNKLRNKVLALLKIFKATDLSGDYRRFEMRNWMDTGESGCIPRRPAALLWPRTGFVAPSRGSSRRSIATAGSGLPPSGEITHLFNRQISLYVLPIFFSMPSVCYTCASLSNLFLFFSFFFFQFCFRFWSRAKTQGYQWYHIIDYCNQANGVKVYYCLLHANLF